MESKHMLYAIIFIVLTLSGTTIDIIKEYIENQDKPKT